MTDIIASPAVKEAVKIVMEQQERLGKNAAEAVSAADLPGASQPIRASVLRAAQLAHEAEDHARNRQHVKGKLTARERLDLLLDTGSFEEIGRFCGGDINGGRAGAAVITGFGEVFGRKVAVYAQDFSVRGGTRGVAEGRKICRLMDNALDLKVPIIALIRIFLHKLCECLSFDVVSGNGPAAVFFDRDCLNGRNVDAANGLNSCADQSFV